MTPTPTSRKAAPMSTDQTWQCEDCAWPWPRAGKPPAYAECDNCGGELVPVSQPSGFPATIPASDTDDPAKWWRLLDASGTAQDYSVRPDARRAMYDASGSSAVYGRTRSGVWRLDETLLREG